METILSIVALAVFISVVGAIVTYTGFIAFWTCVNVGNQYKDRREARRKQREENDPYQTTLNNIARLEAELNEENNT